MLLFCDSFDHYSTPSQKWTASQRQGISTANGRYHDAGYTESNGVAGTGGSLTKIIDTPVDTLIAGAAVKFTGQSHFRWLFQEGATIHIAITITGSGKIQVRLGAGGTLLATGTVTLAVNTYYYLEVKCKVNDTTGAVTVRVNGATDCSFSGDTRNGGATGLLDRFAQSTPYLGATGNGFSYFDDFVLMDTTGSVNNDFLGDVRVEALIPSGNGNSSDMFGSDGDSTDNFDLVNERPPDGDTTWVESSTPGEEDTYTYTPVISTQGQVHAVQACMFARQTDSPNVRTVAARQRLGATEVAGSDRTLAATFAYLNEMWETDADGNPWTLDNVAASEFGVEVTA